MPELLELLETIRSEEASVQRLFSSEDGAGVRRNALRSRPDYKARLLEAVRLIEAVVTGRKPAYILQEAMSTSDFPILFGDVLDREMLAAYQEFPPTYRNWAKVKPDVPDFREIKKYAIAGGSGRLGPVKESGPYPETKLDESQIGYRIAKYGRRMPFTWEAMINDVTGVLKDIPERFGKASRRSEEWFAEELIFDASGPRATVFSAGNGNLITGNPALSIAGIQTGFETLYALKDSEGEPIYTEVVHLIVSAGLAPTAKNILNAIQVELSEAGGTTGRKLTVLNWMKNNLRLSVAPYLPLIASTANGNTTWILAADPSDGPPLVEVGFLRGHAEPEIFMRQPNAVRVGGGAVDPFAGDFDSDAIDYKVRHVFGGMVVDPKRAVASNGSGA